MLETLLNNLYPSIIFVVLLVAIIGVLWYKGKKKEALKLIEYLVNTAESKFGQGTGEYKYDFVIGKVYPALPALARLAFPPTVVDHWIEDEVNKIQAKLEEAIENTTDTK